MNEYKKSLLKQLYDGEFDPGEHIVSSDPERLSRLRKIGDEIEYISGRLSDSDKTRFDKLLDLMSDSEYLGGCAEFSYGLRTGILLMIELFSHEKTPPFAEI